MTRVRPDGAGEILCSGQRHHLAANLGEPLHTAKDRHPIVRRDGHHVAGIVPAVHRGLDPAARVEIAGHHIGSAHVKPPAAGDAFHRLQPRFDAREQTAHRAPAVIRRFVHGHHRGGLGGAIALQHGHVAEFVSDQVMGLFPNLFSATDDKLQTRHLVGFGHARILVDEGVGGQKDRGAGVFQ